MENKYQKGMYVSFMTNQIVAQINRMVGYNDLGSKDFDKTENIGVVNTVIDGNTYLIRSLGFYCIAEDEDILRSIPIEELDHIESPEPTYRQAPNVYICQEVPEGNSISDKCESAAREAMQNLFPSARIESVEMTNSNFLKSDLKEVMYELFPCFNRELTPELREKLESFEKELKAKRFKEYYSVIVGVYDNEDIGSCLNYLVAVDLNFEEVSIMRNINERTCFFRSLGPEYYQIYNHKMELTHKILG